MSTEKSPLPPNNIRPLIGKTREQPGKPRSKAAPRSQRIKLIELLLEVSRRMAAYDTLDDVLHAMVDMTTTEIGAERGSHFLNDTTTKEQYWGVAQGNIKPELTLWTTGGMAGNV